METTKHSTRLISVHCSNCDILKCFTKRQYNLHQCFSKVSWSLNQWETIFCTFLAASKETVYFFMFQCFAAFWNTLSKVSKISWRSKRKISGKNFSACMVIFLSECCGYVQFSVSLLTLLIFCNQDRSKVNFLWAWCSLVSFQQALLINSQIFAGMMQWCFVFWE